ncbi:MAG: hypothetical protein HYZ31_04275 [Gammaproteobacteria bacterium]|nr:hypothetical protein [Gammaproteobacteria bacterium]
MRIRLCLIIFFSVFTIGCATSESKNTGQTSWVLTAEKNDIKQFVGGSIGTTADDVYLTDTKNLYNIREGKPLLVAKTPQDDAYLQLAPGGKVYAWLVPNPAWQGLSSIQLMSMPYKKVSELHLDEFPYGFGALILGYEGNIIVGVSPLDDWQGLTGRFQFTFYNREGKLLKKLILPKPYTWVLDPLGNALLLLGTDDAIAFDATGERLWQINGRFRKAAIADAGKLALLNPVTHDDIDKVLIYTGLDKPVSLQLPTPVHQLSLTPDGKLGVIVGDKARYFLMDTHNKKLDEGAKLDLPGVSFISDIQILNKNTFAIGLLHRSGEPPLHTWTTGSIVTVDRDGRVIFKKSFMIRKPLAAFPSITTRYDTKMFIGRTVDEAVFVDLTKQASQQR